MKIHILYGTESGESEFKAEEISDVLSDRFEVSVANMSDAGVTDIDPAAFYIIVCSTYGEGELPTSAKPFHAALSAERPDLSSLSYAVFGRGDTTYLSTYSRGSEQIDELLRELGATRVGEYGRDDAGDWDAPEDLATQWAEGIASLLTSITVARSVNSA